MVSTGGQRSPTGGVVACWPGGGVGPLVASVGQQLPVGVSGCLLICFCLQGLPLQWQVDVLPHAAAVCTLPGVYLMSPMLHSLTKNISEDSVIALIVGLYILHLFLYNYG
jgi:hypothetical protein